MSAKKARLDEVCDFVRGLTYSKNDEVDFSTNVVLRATNIDLSTNQIDLNELRYIADSVVVKDEKKLKAGDTLICTASGSKSHLGKVAFIESDLEMAFGGFMGVLRPRKEINPKFLFSFLISDGFLNAIRNLSDGANINNLKFSQIAGLEIGIPSLPTQKKIVVKLESLFTELDKAISATEANIKNSETLFQSYLSKIFEDLISTKKIANLKDICIFENGDRGKNYPSKQHQVESGIPFINAGDLKESWEISNEGSFEMFEASERGEIELGGCVIADDQPERKCLACKHEWLIKRRSPSFDF